MLEKCPICLDASAHIEDAPAGRDAYEIACPRCGPYLITRTAGASDLSKYGPRHLMSAIIRNRAERGERMELGILNFEHLMDSAPHVDDPFSKIDLLLGHVLRLGGRVDKPAMFNSNHDFPLIFAEDNQEFSFYLKKGIDIGLLENAGTGYRLTLEGWKRLRELYKPSSQSEQAFVAMWFDKSLDKAWENGLKPALITCNLKPLRIDLEEHNEKICDRIISEIRRSCLVVSDFTGQRGASILNLALLWDLGFR